MLEEIVEKKIKLLNVEKKGKNLLQSKLARGITILGTIISLTGAEGCDGPDYCSPEQEKQARNYCYDYLGKYVCSYSCEDCVCYDGGYGPEFHCVDKTFSSSSFSSSYCKKSIFDE